MVSSYFFFSYARANRDNAHRERQDGTRYNLVDEFFEDLCRHLSDTTGKSASQVGYRDTSNLHVSAPWPQELAEAIQRTQVLVALISPHYLASVNCGREFETFLRRFELLKQRTSSATTASPILPVFWINADQCWPHATARATRHLEELNFTAPIGSLPENYPAVGLCRHRVLGRRQDYEGACIYIADRIKQLAERRPELPALHDVDDFRDLSSAFDPDLKDDRPLRPESKPVLDVNRLAGGTTTGETLPTIQLTP